MPVPALDHVLIADPNTAQALEFARWIEVDYDVRFADSNDSELDLSRIKNFTVSSDEIPSKVAGSIISLEADVSGLKSIGSKNAKLGTLEYLYRRCLIGPSPYKAGPILIYGHQTVEEIAELGELEVNILSLPGVRYIQTPVEKGSDFGLFVAREFKQAVEHCLAFQIKSPEARGNLFRARNKLIAAGLFKSIRRLSRILVHDYNSLLTAKHLPKTQPKLIRDRIDALAVYVDFQVHYSTGSVAVKKFQDVLRDYYEVVNNVSKLRGRRELSRAFEKIVKIFSELGSLIAWWESLLSWSHLAIARQHQAIEAVIVDDEKEFSVVLRDALKSEELVQKLSATLGRELKINAIVIEPEEQPEQIIRVLREKNLHESAALTGSPVVVFQDLIIHGREDFGLKVVRRLRSRYPWLRIVAVTAREKARFEALEEGADFYLTKTDLLGQRQNPNGQIDLDSLAMALNSVLAPSSVLVLGDVPRLNNSRCLKLLCERYWLDSNPVSLLGQSTREICSRLSLEGGLPRLLLITGNQTVTYEEFFRQIMFVREICLLFPDLSIVIWRPDISMRNESLHYAADRWFELWAKWIPNYASRVLPIDRPFADGFYPPINAGDGEMLDLFFSAEELEAVESLLRVNTLFSNIAAYNFYIPRLITPEGATGAIAAPTDVETDVADKIAERFGGSSVSVISGRWIGERGVADYDTIVAIESFAPVTRANRAFAKQIVEEIRERRNEEVVLQIERPISVISRENEISLSYLQDGLYDEKGLIDGAVLFESLGR